SRRRPPGGSGTAVDFLPTPEGGGFQWLRRVFPGGRGTADAVGGVASGDRGTCGSTLRRFPSTNSPVPRCRVGPRHPHHKPALNKKFVTKTSGGCPGLQAGEESGFPRSGAGTDGSPPGEPASPAAVPSAVSNR